MSAVELIVTLWVLWIRLSLFAVSLVAVGMIVYAEFFWPDP